MSSPPTELDPSMAPPVPAPVQTAPAASKSKSPRRPEKKYGPFAGGVGVAVWLNSVEDAQGLRYFRSISINPRRYRDKETGQWLDGGSFKLTDLPALILALEAAHTYSAKTTLPGLPADDEEAAPTDTGGEIPF